MSNTKMKDIKEYINTSYNVSSVIKGKPYFVKLLLGKCQNLFFYEGLPDSIPAWEMEKSLIIKGSGGVVKVRNKLFIPFTGSVYGFDEYYVPNQFTYAQPLLGSGSITDMVSGVIVWNSEVDKIDYNTSWLFECINRYADMLAQLESTFVNSLVTKRTGRLGVAPTSNMAIALDNALDKIFVGETKSIVDNMQVFDGIKSTDFKDTNNLSELSQVRDYLFNCFYNEIGLQTLEEKKERMISSELEVDQDVLCNNVLGMYASRKKNIEKINEFYNIDAKVVINPLLGV